MATNRPLSPHLQIYKPQLTSALSIFHRICGIVLSVGAVALVWWLASIAAGPQAYASAQKVAGAWYGKLFLFGWSLCLFYHLCNGIRHLGWDLGYGFSLPAAYRSGALAVAGAVVLTLAAWAVGYARL